MFRFLCFASVAILAQAVLVQDSAGAPSGISFSPAMSTAVGVLAELHGEVLRDLCAATGQPAQGLAMAAALARRRGLISNRVAKKVVHLGIATAWTRHATNQRAEQFRLELCNELNYSVSSGNRAGGQGRAGNVADPAAQSGHHMQCKVGNPVCEQKETEDKDKNENDGDHSTDPGVMAIASNIRDEDQAEQLDSALVIDLQHPNNKSSSEFGQDDRRQQSGGLEPPSVMMMMGKQKQQKQATVSPPWGSSSEVSPPGGGTQDSSGSLGTSGHCGLRTNSGFRLEDIDMMMGEQGLEGKLRLWRWRKAITWFKGWRDAS